MLAQDDYFAAVELGLEGLNPQIDCNISPAYGEDGEELEGVVTAVLTVTEDLRFHLDLDRKYPMDDAVLFDADGVMTEAAQTALEKVITERYDGEQFEYEDGDGNPENAFFRFEIALTVPADTTPEDLSTKLWEETKLVQFHNEADPGTFGSQYLFGTVIADAMKQA